MNRLGLSQQYTSHSWRSRFPYLYPPGTWWHSYTPGHWVRVEEVEVDIKVHLRPTVSRSVWLPMTRFRFHVWRLLISRCGAPSLTRGWVYNLLYNRFWALPEQSLLGPSPSELRPYFTVSFETPPTWRARSLYLYPPGTEWPSYTPGHCVPFL
jgi:hypothetical protein